MTIKKPLNSTVYYPVNQVSNITSNNYNLVLSTTPNIVNEQKTRVSSPIVKESENVTKIVNVNSKKRDAETQTEEIFFKMYFFFYFYFFWLGILSFFSLFLYKYAK